MIGETNGYRVAGSGRLLHLELLRAIAIFLVVFNHTGTRGFLLFASTNDRFLYPVYLFISIGCKIAVPLFFMVSGALLIPKKDSLGSLYKNRVLRFAIAIVLFSFAQYVYTRYRIDPSIGISGFFVTAYSSPVIVPYYFLYLYLAILIMLPFLRKMALNMNNAEFIYLASLQLVLIGLLPIFEYLVVGRPINLEIAFVAMNMFFFLMGYFMEHRVDARYYRKKYAFIAFGAGFACIALSGLMTWIRAAQTGDTSVEASQVFHYGLIAIPTFSTFFLVKYFAETVPLSRTFRKGILWFGGTAFGIYLLERIFRVELDPVFTRLQPVLHSLLASIVWVLAILAVGALATTVLKRVPGVKKIL